MKGPVSISRFRTIALALALCAPGAGAVAQQRQVNYVDQGRSWTATARNDFYTRDQGSQIIPLAWARALTTADGEPFLGENLLRYGYLANPQSPDRLPVGFMAGGPRNSRQFAMNCAACHTRQISVGQREYRIDGGPALSDFRTFLLDLDGAVERVLASDEAFDRFAAAVLGPNPDPANAAQLRVEVQNWYLREHAMISRAVRGTQWGLGRLDAVSMIFNRVAGLDIGPPPTFLIPENIRLADAPVRYPFLWNAPRQDRTQWPGFAQNGNDLLGLARNLGQVYGVFGRFRPQRSGNHVDFMVENSANFDSLGKLEELVKRIGPPRWQWPVQSTLASQGEEIFNRDWQEGGCAQCHGERRGAYRIVSTFPFFTSTWATPLCDVGTDTRQYSILNRPAQTGALKGASLLFGAPLPEEARAFDLLAMSVIGSIVQQAIGFSPYWYREGREARRPTRAQTQLTHQVNSIYSPAPLDACDKQADEHGLPFKYESRVLEGIWATAPYLHNGSVPTLAALLMPGPDRPASFALGRRYDIENVGLAVDQGPGAPTRTTPCEPRDSGDSRCGHEYGVSLDPGEKAALLEYLKTL